MSSDRFRNYALITYHSEEVIKSVLALYKARIRHFAYILHDKDVYESDVFAKDSGVLLHKKGDLKESHYHVLLCMNNPITRSAIRNLFPPDQNTLAQPIRDKSDCFVYLNHKDNPNKYQYPDDAIVCDDLAYWQSAQNGESDDRTENIIDDLIAGVAPRELAKRYGRDFVINSDKYRAYARWVRYSEVNVPSNLSAGITVEDIPISKKPKQIEMDDIVFSGVDGYVVIDGKTGEIKDRYY